MPVDEIKDFNFSIPTLKLAEEFKGLGFPTYIEEKDLIGVPYAKISADAEATFECETIVNPNLMRKLCGLDLANGVDVTVGQSFTFTCKTPRSVQVRKHRKKRINKKWAKKYGYKYIFEPLEIRDISIVNRDNEIDILGRVVR